MKAHSLCILILMIVINSCSVYEDIKFKEDGSVYYELTLKQREGSSSHSQDTISSLPALASTYLKNTSELKRDLDNITPVFIKFEGADIVFYGDFENADSLNSSIKSIYNIMINSIATDESTGSKETLAYASMWLYNAIPVYSWDGTSMKSKGRPSIKSLLKEEELKNYSNDNNPDWSYLIPDNKKNVKYHFPKVVISSSDTTVLLTFDRKTVIKVYDAPYTNPQNTDIELGIEKYIKNQ